jgi:hypothetical protein
MIMNRCTSHIFGLTPARVDDECRLDLLEDCLPYCRVDEYGGLYLKSILASAALACLGATSAIEFFYHQQLQSTTGQPMRWLGRPWDTEQALPWLAAALALVSGLACLAFFKRRWQQALAELEPLQRQGKP